nr:immunoglobulin heavy chain junction region [Macaca mulatta]MOV86738.1 immunoglobulin heavy chain junction region [Macaca mulatta]MOV86892.1 immunoglobulin heavy chain junction region [Macaca mulatta]MOV87066.1 immunoglobulin heavy chain junction region [Macaca mulatta]MOV87100.1 immunoglobulin heavy chain junction region [Macaca mulatta]
CVRDFYGSGLDVW